MEEKEITKLKTRVKKFPKMKKNKQVDVYIDLVNALKELKLKQKVLKSLFDIVDEKLVKIFEKDETQGVNQRGLYVYLHDQIWAGRCEGIQVIDAVAGLRKAKLGKKYVKESVDMDKLHVLFRELAKEAEDGNPNIPDNLKDYFQANEIFSIRSRKS